MSKLFATTRHLKTRLMPFPLYRIQKRIWKGAKKMNEHEQDERWGMKRREKNGLKVVDLFSGAGIGAVGILEAGYEIVYAIDNKKYAVDTYNQNIGNHAVLGDIRKLSATDLPDADLYTGGFPCQPFSLGGKGEGEKDKKQGDLAKHFHRLVKEGKPKAFLIENVGGILTKNHKEFFLQLMQLFRELGYKVSWEYLNCYDYGVPQLRKRVFAIGIREDIEGEFKFPEKVSEEQRTTIRDAIGDLPEPDGVENHEGYGIRNDEQPFVDKIPAGGNWRDLEDEDQKIFLGKAYYSGGGRTGFLRKVKFDKPAFTITSQMKGKNNAQIVDNQDKYHDGGFSPRYKSRNRQKQWDEPSFTIVSQARQLPLHPEPPHYDIREMDINEFPPPRRFTVRECLRLQTVPDWFYFSKEISLAKQYERCSGIPSLMSYKLGIEIEKVIGKEE